MNKEDIRYFNFPIVLLEGFMEDDRQVLENISDYAIYSKCIEYEEKEGFEWTVNEEIGKSIDLAGSYFGITIYKKTECYKNGKMLYDSIPQRTPMVGVSKDIWFDYYKNDKTEFQKVCLLGFLGIKSIVQNKAYCKIDNKYWLSRMSGKAKSINDVSELPIPIEKYYTTKYTRKIKTELIHNWGLTHYSYYTRGFYVSFKLTLEELVFEAEKRRKSTKEKQLKIETQNARLLALQRLKKGTP